MVNKKFRQVVADAEDMLKENNSDKEEEESDVDQYSPFFGSS